MEYDVAIVGGGPSGSWLARELSRQKISVVLLERSTVAGEPNFSSAGSPFFTVEKFDLPKAAVAGVCDRIKIIGPSLERVWTYGKPTWVVFDFRALKKLLLGQAQSLGAEIMLGAAVESVEEHNDHVAVHARSLAHPIKTKIFVDATGFSGIIASQIGLRKRVPAIPSPGLEVILDAPSMPEIESHTLTFYLGNRWAPHGYGWIFPMGGSSVKVGIGAAQAARWSVNLDVVLKELLPRIPWAHDARIIEKHGGSVWAAGGIKNHVHGRILVIGDAADQVNPLGGEGIRHVLYSASYAAAVIIEALRRKDLSRLRRYNSLWKNTRDGNGFYHTMLPPAHMENSRIFVGIKRSEPQRDSVPMNYFPCFLNMISKLFYVLSLESGRVEFPFKIC